MTTTTTTDTTSSTDTNSDRYLEPDTLTRRFMNPVVSTLTKLGISVRGSRVLEIRGRTSGEWRSVPVNPLTIDGERYLVAPRGQTQWVRNLRVAGGGRLRKGRRVEDFTAGEIIDAAEAVPILRAYLEKWSFEVGSFFEGLTPDSSDDELTAAASGFPVFRITAT